MSQKPDNSEWREIDFLPARFREQNTQRKVNVPRLIAVAGLAMIIPSLLLYQFGVHSGVRGQLSDLRVRYNKAKIEETRLNRLRATFLASNACAELYTFLDHRWPTTQLLNATTRNLPDSVAITELTARLVAHPSNSKERVVRKRRPAPGKEQIDDRPPARKDLDKLRAKAQEGQWVITLSGETLDTTELYNYIGGLADEPLFDRAELDSVQAPQGKSEVAAKFQARIMVRNGYGLPHGPTGDETTADRALTSDAKAPVVARRQHVLIEKTEPSNNR